MKTLSNTQMNDLIGGRTSDATCAYLGAATLGSALTGNLLAFAIIGTIFSAACM